MYHTTTADVARAGIAGGLARRIIIVLGINGVGWRGRMDGGIGSSASRLRIVSRRILDGETVQWAIAMLAGVTARTSN